jgi:hypothetical protein
MNATEFASPLREEAGSTGERREPSAIRERVDHEIESL